MWRCVTRRVLSDFGHGVSELVVIGVGVALVVTILASPVFIPAGIAYLLGGRAAFVHVRDLVAPIYLALLVLGGLVGMGSDIIRKIRRVAEECRREWSCDD